MPIQKLHTTKPKRPGAAERAYRAERAERAADNFVQQMRAHGAADMERAIMAKARDAERAARARQYFLGSAALSAMRALMGTHAPPDEVARMAFRYAKAMLDEHDRVSSYMPPRDL